MCVDVCTNTKSVDSFIVMKFTEKWYRTPHSNSAFRPRVITGAWLTQIRSPFDETMNWPRLLSRFSRSSREENAAACRKLAADLLKIIRLARDPELPVFFLSFFLRISVFFFFFFFFCKFNYTRIAAYFFSKGNNESMVARKK